MCFNCLAIKKEDSYPCGRDTATGFCTSEGALLQTVACPKGK